jgi:ABC-type nitrate/sulfonate/bicarbonate transport system substrate-binding protein
MSRPTPTPIARTLRLTLAGTVAVGLALTGCGSSKPSTAASTTAGTSPGTTRAAGASVTNGSAFPADRCAANKAAGKITYLSGFDFAAAASIVEVVVAKEKGYFDKVCLDVDVKPSFTTANYPLVGANTAQFASAGSYTEMLGYNKDGAHFVALAIDGKVGVDALLVKPDSGITTPAGLKGKKVGVKGALPPAEVALLNKYGLKEGNDYEEVSLDGFDPKVHWALPIDALPIYKSNETGQLDAAGIKYTMFDPAKEGIPGDFGVLYTNAKFTADHPTAVQDFVRAAMKGMEDAQADPGAAVKIAVAKINGNGNPNFLSEAGEGYRWGVEAKLVKDNTPAGEGIGVIHPDSLTKLVDAYTTAGVFTTKPSTDSTYSDLAKGVYDSAAKVVWPA